MSVGSCREGRVENVVDIKLEQLLRYCKKPLLPNVAAFRETEPSVLVGQYVFGNGTFQHFNSHVSIVLGLAFSLGLIFAAPKTQLPRPISFPAAA